MVNLFSRLLLLVGIFAMTSVVSANTKNAQQTSAYLNSMDFKKLIYNTSVYWDREVLNLQTNCTSKYSIEPVSLAIIKPLVFENGDQTPSDGIWTYRYQFIRCGETIIYNIYAIAQKNQAPKILRMFPGESRISPTLFKDLTVGIASGTALWAKENAKGKCQNIKVLNSEITMQPFTLKSEGKTYDGAWEEKWTIKRCEDLVPLNFCFIPVSVGGTNWSLNKCQ